MLFDHQRSSQCSPFAESDSCFVSATNRLQRRRRTPIRDGQYLIPIWDILGYTNHCSSLLILKPLYCEFTRSHSPCFPKPFLHQLPSYSSSFKMASTQALAWANNLRVASMTLLVYEYVVRCVLLALLRTYICPVISSHSPPNCGCTRRQVDVGRRADPRVRTRFNRNHIIAGVSYYLFLSGIVINIVFRST